MKPTPGPVNVYHFANSEDACDMGLWEIDEAGEQIRDLWDSDQGEEAVAVAQANADLITEAFDVHTETGLTPRQLAEQRDALEAENTQLKAEMRGK